MQKRRLNIIILVYLMLGFLSNSLIANVNFFGSTPVEQPAIDAMIALADEEFKQEKYAEAEKLYETILEQSKKEAYSKGLVYAYLGFSSIYFVQSKIELSTDYLIKAKAQAFAQNNPKVLGEIYFSEALNMHAIGLLDQAIERYHESLSMLNQIEDEAERDEKALVAYNNIGDAYQLLSQKDSALYYYKLAYNSPTDNPNSKFTSAASIADLYIDDGAFDSAKTYLSFTEYYADQINTNFSKSISSEIFGKYYQGIGQYEEAIALYKTSIALNDQIKRPRAQLLKLLSETYRKNGEEQAANNYLKKYVYLKDSLDHVSLANLKAVPSLMDASSNNVNPQEAKASTKWYYITAILLILSGGFFYIKQLKSKRRKGKQENLQLKKKLNNAFEEVVELAESNSPNFLARFIEVYPELYNQLITDCPELTTADLKVCALLKLDYSTKEIAEITFSSLRTVQNRMYKIRKKLNLNSEEKLDRWIQTLHIESLNQV
ncbi:MAG TPA: hypothetical protein VL022_02090 [Moheibacter sp.]|nr:hypothetical protein [Moheibacter sp.]